MSAMKAPWRAALIAGACAGLWLLWRLTALEDAEWALWRHYSPATTLINIALSALILAGAYVLYALDDAAERIGRVALIGGSLICAVGALELPVLLTSYDYSAILHTRANDTWLQLAMGVNRPDPELLHVHKPHTRYQGTVRGNLVQFGIPNPAAYQVDVAYDGNGFRNDRDYTRAEIVAIGDSFVEGAEMPRGETAAAQIARVLGVDVVNLGQSSYGPQQELVVLKRYGLPLRPSVVIWFFFGGNDLGDVDEYERRRSRLGELTAPQAMPDRLFTRNAIIALARLTTGTRRTVSPTARLHAAEFTRADGTTQTIYVEANEGPWEQRQWDAAAAALSSAQAAVHQSGAELLVVYIPRKLRVYRGFLRAEPGAYALSWKDNNLPDALGDWCRDRGIAYLDSTGPLRSAVATGESVYLPDDVHWNAAGHRVVAHAVSERVRHMRGLPEAELQGVE